MAALLHEAFTQRLKTRRFWMVGVFLEIAPKTAHRMSFSFTFRCLLDQMRVLTFDKSSPSSRHIPSNFKSCNTYKREIFSQKLSTCSVMALGTQDPEMA